MVKVISPSGIICAELEKKMESNSRQSIRAGVIGTGLRATSYLANLPPEVAPHVRVVALADPDERRRTLFAARFASAETRQYRSGAQLLESEELDALVIASPNAAHAADAVLALQRRIPLLLEKPVATTAEDCARLWRAYLDAGRPPVSIGFVLRYTPFYQQVAALLRENVAGQVLSVDADELIGPAVTRLFFGGWRRHDTQSGGFLVEKCSHDFDLLRWLTGSEARRVFAVARRTHFNARPATERLPRFDRVEAVPEALDYSDAQTQWEFSTALRRSLYEIEGDLPDHQSVLIEWENGVLTSFTAAFAQPRTTRRIRVSGTGGTLQGDIGRSQITVEAAGDTEAEMLRREIEIAHDESGHHGGDGNIAAHFWRACAGEVLSEPAGDCSAGAGLREGIEAVLIAIAAQRAAQTGTPQELAPLRAAIFGE